MALWETRAIIPIYPNAPCTDYLPTGEKWPHFWRGNALVNFLYEHLGMWWIQESKSEVFPKDKKRCMTCVYFFWNRMYIPLIQGNPSHRMLTIHYLFIWSGLFRVWKCITNEHGHRMKKKTSWAACSLDCWGCKVSKKIWPLQDYHTSWNI